MDLIQAIFLNLFYFNIESEFVLQIETVDYNSHTQLIPEELKTEMRTLIILYRINHVPLLCFDLRPAPYNILGWKPFGNSILRLNLLKLRHSEKTTKFEKNLPLVLTLLCKCQNKWDIFFKFCGLLRKPQL